MLCGSLDGRGVEGGEMNICMAESLCCPQQSYHNSVNWLYSSKKFKKNSLIKVLESSTKGPEVLESRLS